MRDDETAGLKAQINRLANIQLEDHRRIAACEQLAKAGAVLAASLATSPLEYCDQLRRCALDDIDTELNDLRQPLERMLALIEGAFL